MPSEGFFCNQCDEVFEGSRLFNDHLRQEHQAQQIVCPWCPKWTAFSVPGSLRRHVNKQHHGLEMEDDLLAVNVAYYFATNPSLYRNTTTVKHFQEAISKKAVATLRLWTETVGTDQARGLLERAESDWRHLGAADPTIKQEPDGRNPQKRPSDIPPVYTPEKRQCNLVSVPRLDDLELLAIHLTNTVSRAHVSWFVRGTFEVDVGREENPSRTLFRRMQALVTKPQTNQSLGDAELVTDREVIRVLAEKIGLSFKDILSARFQPECHKQFALPNTATVSDEEFGTAGVLPAGLTSPEPQSDSSASSNPLSDTPQENVQEVPGTRAPSPPALSGLLEQLEYYPTVTPAPSSLTIPQAPLAPPPRPFRDTFTAAQPVERSAKAAAFDLLRTGSWPSLCPGRRDWAKGSVNIPLPVQTITWPPRNWSQMTKEQRQAAWQAMAIVLSLADEPAGSFPSHDPAVIMDDYSFLALPGSGPTPSATTPADRAMSELRATNHRGLKYALEDTRDQRHLRGLTQGLAAGVGKGPRGRRRVLELVNAAAVPLRPLRKEAPAPAKTTAAPAKVTSIAAYAPSVPAYSPTRPGLKQ